MIVGVWPRLTLLLATLALPVVLVAPARAAPRLTEERLMCTVAELSGPAGAPTRLRVECGSRHGVMASSRGEIYAREKDGGIHVAGRVEVAEVRERDTWLRVLPAAGSKLDEITTAGVVELRVLLPSDIYRGLLFHLYVQGVTFLDNYKEPIAALEDVLGARDASVEERALAKMIVAGHEVVEFTTELKQQVTHGRWKGKTCGPILAGSTADDYRAFLRFVRDYPGKYIGKKWKISEVYATWLINDAPPSNEDQEGDLVAAASAKGPAALEAAVGELKPKDLASVFERVRRGVTDLPRDKAQEGEARVKVLEKVLGVLRKGGKAAPALLEAEVAHARARLYTLDPKKKKERAASYGRAAELYGKVSRDDMREAVLERIVCENNQADALWELGQTDEVLRRVPLIRAECDAVEKGGYDAEVTAHARLSEAYTIGLGARVANERGDYRKVVEELTPVLDRFGAVGAPGFRQKEIDLIEFVVKAHKKLGEIDAASKLLERARLRAAEIGDTGKELQIAWNIADNLYDSARYADAQAGFERAAQLARDHGEKAWTAKALAAAGQALWSMGKPKEALARHAEGMALREETGDESGIAWQLVRMGDIRVELGEREAARKDYERALALHEKGGRRRDEGEVLMKLGHLFVALTQPAEADKSYGAARAIYRELKMAPDEAWAVLGGGRARSLARDYPEAVARATEAATIGDKTGERELRVRAHSARSRWLRELGRRPEGTAAMEQALAAVGSDAALRIDVLVERTSQRQDDGDLAGAASDAAEALKQSDSIKDAGRRLSALLARAGLLQAHGDYEASVRAFDEIAALARETGARPMLGSALQRKAWQLANLGRLREAKQTAEEAQKVAEQNGDPVEQAWAMNALARVAGDVGDVREELRLYDAAIPLMQTAGLRFGEAALTFNRALISARLRDFDEALRGIDKAQALAKDITTSELELAMGGERGFVLGQLGRYDEADKVLAAAAERARVALPQRVPGLLSARGKLWVKRGEPDKAMPLLEEAVAIEGKRSPTAFSELGELGVAQARAGRPEAETTLREVVARAEKAGGLLPWEPLYQLGRIEAEAGRVDDALKTLGRAAREIEKGEVVLSSDAARTRYFGDKVGVYTLLVKLLLGRNEVGEALRYVERAKAAELEELRRSAGGQEGDIGLELEVAESRFDKELRAEQQKPAPDPDKLRRLDELLADVRRRRADYIDKLDREIAEKAAAGGGARDSYSIRPLELEKLQQHVQPGTLVLSPLSLDDRLVVFAVTHDAITHFDVKVPAREVERLVSLVLDEVAPAGGTQRGAAPLQRGSGRKLDEASLKRLRDPAGRLHQLLLAPALARFGMPAVLVVSASGGLRYLPFAALHDGKRWLVEQTALVEVTSLDQQKFAAVTAAPQKATVLALADPDGSLPGARKEVDDVKGVFGDVRVLDGQGATLAALRSEIRSPGYDIVHLATHGRLDGAHPEQSHILLAGQPLYYKDIPALRFARTRLVVLSACDTASRGSGVEVTGLAYQFERTNVRAVVATLWPVSDAATAVLMADFYRRLRGGESDVVALAQAQRALAARPEYQHPYYWAPFVLIGAP